MSAIVTDVVNCLFQIRLCWLFGCLVVCWLLDVQFESSCMMLSRAEV